MVTQGGARITNITQHTTFTRAIADFPGNDDGLIKALEGVGAIPQAPLSDAQIHEYVTLTPTVAGFTRNRQRLIEIFDGAGGTLKMQICHAEIHQCSAFVPTVIFLGNRQPLFEVLDGFLWLSRIHAGVAKTAERTAFCSAVTDVR